MGPLQLLDRSNIVLALFSNIYTPILSCSRSCT